MGIQIHELTALNRAPQTWDVLAVDTGTTTNKVDYSALRGAVLTDAVRTDDDQNLTDAQKAQAIENIGAATQADVTAIEDEIGNTTLPTTAQTVTGAIAEHETDISGINSAIGTVPSGSNLQGEVDELKSAFDVYDEYTIGYKNPMSNITYTEDYFIGSDGTISQNSSFKYSDYIPIKTGEKYSFVFQIASTGSMVRIHGYNSNKNWVSNFAYFSYNSAGQYKREYIIPATVEYLRISENKSNECILITPDKSVIDLFSSGYGTLGKHLIVCGNDAKDYQKMIAECAKRNGFGYVCESGELDTGVNTFIDSFMSESCTIEFFGTIRTSAGIHKHPKHNLIGYDCTLKMGDSLGTDYVSCIFPTAGGKTFAQQQVISHNHTFIKGFTLDGNRANNTDGGSGYSFKSIYGALISGGIYNEEVAPYSKTQLAADIVLEDITGINSMRGIIPSIGWVCRNLTIGDAVTDHALYLAGADGAVVDNVIITGEHANGAIAISGQSWDTTRKVRNIRMKNIFINECSGGPYLDIRGHFSDSGNDMTLDDVFIDNIFIKKQRTNIETIPINIGTTSVYEKGSMVPSNYPLNVHINNLVMDAKIYATVIAVNNACVDFTNTYIKLSNYRPERALIRIQSNNALKNVVKFDRFRFVYDGAEKDVTANFFGVYPDNGYVILNGLCLEDAIIEGITNYNLIGRSGSATNGYTIKNLVLNRVIASPLHKLDPNAESNTQIVANDYYE